MTKPIELRRLSLPELEERIKTLRHQLFVSGIQHSQRQLGNPSQLRKTKRELARVLTIVGELRRAGAGKGENL